MSQSREQTEDRSSYGGGCRANLKTELQIRHLPDKMSYLLITRWQRFLEIQEVQIEPLEEIIHKAPRLHRIPNYLICNTINK
jgi:uncharacterized membrane protein